MYIFSRASYFKRYCTFCTSKLNQLFSKNLIVIFGGQNWLIPYIVQIWRVIQELKLKMRKVITENEVDTDNSGDATDNDDKRSLMPSALKKLTWLITPRVLLSMSLRHNMRLKIVFINPICIITQLSKALVL